MVNGLETTVHIAIDKIIMNADVSPLTLKASTILWHSGLCSPDSVENRSIWCESEVSNNKNYVRWAQEAASFDCETRTPYTIQFSLRKDLELINCKGISFRIFTQEHCNNDHSMMKDLLERWCLFKNLDGLFAINGSLSEVLVVRPCEFLDIHSFIKL